MAPARRPWIAALLSLLQPGLGQLYNGSALKAVAFFVCVPLAIAAALAGVMELPSPPLNAALVLALPVLVLLGPAEALREARRLRDQPRPWFGRWWSCLTAWIVAATVSGAVLEVWDSWMRAGAISSASMSATLLPGDRVLIDKAAYRFRLPLLGLDIPRRGPQRGDLFVYFSPHDRKQLLHRVVGLPGETVEARNEAIFIDGKRIEEPYATYTGKAGPAASFDPVVVPADHVLVLGDNRRNSFDSRFFGFVPMNDAIGRARVVYFSWDAKAGRLRWEQIGKRFP